MIYQFGTTRKTCKNNGMVASFQVFWVERERIAKLSNLSKKWVKKLRVRREFWTWLTQWNGPTICKSYDENQVIETSLVYSFEKDWISMLLVSMMLWMSHISLSTATHASKICLSFGWICKNTFHNYITKTVQPLITYNVFCQYFCNSTHGVE